MRKLIMIAALLLGIASQAGATTVNFDGLTLDYAELSSFTDGGLTFTSHGSYLYVWDSSSPNSNGTNNMIFAGLAEGDYLSITRTGGGAFDLTSMDLSISWYDLNATETILLNGNPFTIAQGIQTITPNFTGISELLITGVPSNTGYWLADNIVYQESTSAVPEPSTFMLFGAALAGLGIWRRKKA